MDAATLLRAARQRAGLSQRQLALRSGTSHSTLAAYETGTKTPHLSTLVRILEAAGFALEARLQPLGPYEDRRARARQIEAVLALAEAFPSRHDKRLRYPKFPAAVPTRG